MPQVLHILLKRSLKSVHSRAGIQVPIHFPQKTFKHRLWTFCASARKVHKQHTALLKSTAICIGFMGNALGFRFVAYASSQTLQSMTYGRRITSSTTVVQQFAGGFKMTSLYFPKKLTSDVTPSRKSMSWLISDGVSALYTNPASYKIGEIKTAISSMYDSWCSFIQSDPF